MIIIGLTHLDAVRGKTRSGASRIPDTATRASQVLTKKCAKCVCPIYKKFTTSLTKWLLERDGMLKYQLVGERRGTMFCAGVNIYPSYFNASKIPGDNSNCDTKTTMLYSIVVFVSLNKAFFMKQAQAR